MHREQFDHMFISPMTLPKLKLAELSSKSSIVSATRSSDERHKSLFEPQEIDVTHLSLTAPVVIEHTCGFEA